MTEKIKRGAVVRFEGGDYMVANRTREGRLRLLSQPGASHVRELIPEEDVTVIAPAPTPNYRVRVDPARIEAVAAMLREIRERSGLSQRALADAIGVSQSYLYRCETAADESPPSPAYLQVFAEVTGADEDALCAAAGVVPVEVAEALTDLPTLRKVRTLISR